MNKVQVQGVHHITIVGSTKQSAIDFWQGALGMPFVMEQPNLGKPDENHLYFDPGDGRLLTVFTNESREDAGRDAPREVGCVEHIAFNVSRATFQQAPARLRARGIDFIQRDRGFMDSIYLRDPNGLKVELACYKFETPAGLPRRRRADEGAGAARRARRPSHHRRAPRRRDRGVDGNPASPGGRREGRDSGLSPAASMAILILGPSRPPLASCTTCP